VQEEKRLSGFNWIFRFFIIEISCFFNFMCRKTTHLENQPNMRKENDVSTFCASSKFFFLFMDMPLHRLFLTRGLILSA
jgi:hypothetical protein